MIHTVKCGRGAKSKCNERSHFPHHASLFRAFSRRSTRARISIRASCRWRDSGDLSYLTNELDERPVVSYHEA